MAVLHAWVPGKSCAMFFRAVESNARIARIVLIRSK